MKTKLLSLAVAALWTPILAYAVTPPIPPAGFCAHASNTAIATINSLLALLGLGPIC